MLTDVARVTVVPQAAIPGACELCAIQSAALASAVIVQHSHGGTVRFAACDRCALAIRRVAAAAGGQAEFTPPVEPWPVEHATRQERTTVEIVRPLLVAERAERVRDVDGTEYGIRIYGEPQSDGTWMGWIEFVTLDGSRILRTGHETTQSNSEFLAYWATGLEPLYFEGAFQRARAATALV